MLKRIMKQKFVIDYGHFFLMSVAIGVFSVIFAISCEFAFRYFLAMFHYLGWKIIFVIPPAFLIIAYLIRNHFPEAEGSGLPQVLGLNHTTNPTKLSKYFMPRAILSKYIFVVLGTLVGATIGREGPTVQIGATIMTLGKRNLSYVRQKFLYVVGAASGLASAFNTPLGGIVFALEELSKGAPLRKNLIKVSGIAISGMVAVALVGNYSYYGRVDFTLLNYNWRIFIVAALIGLSSGVLCYIFCKGIYYFTVDKTSRINQWRGKHPYWNALICGLLIALIGIISAGLSFGNGYTESRLSLNNSEHLPMFYFVYKMLGSLFSTASGVPGGYFATSLAIGNGIGSFFHHIFAVADIQQYYLLGMVAFLAALTQAPVTAIVMVMEITYSQSFVLPIIVASFVATWVANYFGKSIYEHQIDSYLGKN